MAASAVVSGARSMLRAASSRGVAASTGRFASQAKSVPPMFRATPRRSSLLSPLRAMAGSLTADRGMYEDNEAKDLAKRTFDDVYKYPMRIREKVLREFRQRIIVVLVKHK